MKLKEMNDAYPALAKLAAQDITLPTLYKLSRVLDALEKDIKFIHTEREKIFAKHSEIKDGVYIPLPEKESELLKELDKLADLDSDFDPSAYGLPLEIPETEDIKLSYNDLKALEKIIKLNEKNNI